MSPPVIGAADYAETERRLAAILATDRDLLLVQGEAILLLEACARGLGGPGVRVLNLVSGPYGQLIGDWLGTGGAQVRTFTGSFDAALDSDAVRAAIESEPCDVVSVVHAEASTGTVNPLQEIAAAAHAAGALVLVDAVASVGAEPLAIDAWDLDLVMIGPQKALGGPAGVSALVASSAGWDAIDGNPEAPRNSALSLLDWKERWIDAGRHRLPGYAYAYEMRALSETLDELERDPGLGRRIDAHRRAATASRAGLQALGLEPWVPHPAHASAVVTLARPPRNVRVAEIIEAASPLLSGGRLDLISAAPGPLAGEALRINHTGAAASLSAVSLALVAIGAGMRSLGLTTSVDAALAAAQAAFRTVM